MTPAEARFHRLVALYPAGWQALHGEAYLGVMLDLADAEGRSGPTARERFSALRHAASVWRRELGHRSAGDPVVGSLRWVGPAGLVVGSVLAMLCLTLGDIPGLGAGPGMPGPTWMLALAPAWLAALGTALAGRQRAARLLLAAVAVLPLPALVVALSRLGGATAADGSTLHLFPSLTALVSAALPAGWVDAVVTAQPPLLVLAGSSTCAAVAGLAGPARSRRGRRRTALLVVAGAVAATAYLLAAWGGPTGSVLYRGGLDLLLPPLLPVTAVGTGVGLMLVVHRPGVLAAVALLGWPWATAALVTRYEVPGLHVFPWALEAFALMTVPGLLGAALAAGVALRRLVVTR